MFSVRLFCRHSLRHDSNQYNNLAAIGAVYGYASFGIPAGTQDHLIYGRRSSVLPNNFSAALEAKQLDWSFIRQFVNNRKRQLNHSLMADHQSTRNGLTSWSGSGLMLSNYRT